MEQLELARRLFARDKLLHVDMSEALARGDGELICAEEDGVLIYLPEAETYFHSALTEDCARRLFAQMTRPHYLVATHQRFAAELLLQGHDALREGFCCNAAYLETTPPLAEPACEIRPLDMEAAAFVDAHYDLTDSTEYVRGILARGQILGAFVEGEPAGFVGVHAEGSIGLLEVLPAWRRRGIARALEAAMIARFLSQGQTPYGQVFEGNDASMRLQRALGLQTSAFDICWIAAE